MSDEQQGQKPEKDTQSSMPDDKKPADSEGLPEDSSERTKEQFEKLKEHNKQLAEENKKLKGKKEDRQPQPSVLESLRPTAPAGQAPNLNQKKPVSSGQFSHLNQQQVDSIQESLVQKGKDGYDYVNTHLLQQQLKEANDRARRAELEAQRTKEQFTKYEEDQQIQAAYQKYPQLDPNGEEYDPNFYNLVKGELTSQMMRGEKDLIKAATAVNQAIKSYGKPKEEESSEEKPDTKKVQKQQINASGSAKKSQSTAEFQQLRQDTLQGRKGAVAERLRRSGY